MKSIFHSSLVICTSDVFFIDSTCKGKKHKWRLLFFISASKESIYFPNLITRENQVFQNPTIMSSSKKSGSSSQRSSASSSSSPYGPVMSLITEAFSMGVENSWVPSFLLSSEQLHMPDVTTGLQNATSLLVNLSHNPAERWSDNQFALFPVFSKENITGGIHLQPRRVQEGNSSSRRIITGSLFVFHNELITFLSVEQVSSEDSLTVNYMSKSSSCGAKHAYFRFNTNHFRRLLSSKKFSSAPLINALLSCVIHDEQKQRCSLCNKSNPRSCLCKLRTITPKHPLDFLASAHNFGIHQGEFTGVRLSWGRSRDRSLVPLSRSSIRVKTQVSVDERKAAEMWRKFRGSGSSSSSKR